MNIEKRFCKNCDSELHGEFCSSCGQRDKDFHVPVKELVTEVLDLIPSFDVRLIKSLKPFLFKPGFLTLEYLSGKRKSYISPFKLYFFISFLYFLVSSLTVGKKTQQITSEVAAVDSVGITITKDSGFVSIASTNSGLKFRVEDSSRSVRVLGPRMTKALRNLKSNPQLLFDKINEHRPKFIFLLMPIFAFLLKILYYRSRALYIKHLVFSFYFHSFIFFIFLLGELLTLTSVSIINDVSDIIYLVIPLNLYFGMKRVYRQSRSKTVVKFFLLMSSYLVTFFIVVVITLFAIILLFY